MQGAVCPILLSSAAFDSLPARKGLAHRTSAPAWLRSPLSISSDMAGLDRVMAYMSSCRAPARPITCPHVQEAVWVKNKMVGWAMMRAQHCGGHWGIQSCTLKHQLLGSYHGHLHPRRCAEMWKLWQTSAAATAYDGPVQSPPSAGSSAAPVFSHQAGLARARRPIQQVAAPPWDAVLRGITDKRAEPTHS